MRPGRMTIVLTMFAVGGLGAWMGVVAQDRGTPWPSATEEAGGRSLVESAILKQAASTTFADAQAPARKSNVISATPIQTVAAHALEPNQLPAAVRDTHMDVDAPAVVSAVASAVAPPEPPETATPSHAVPVKLPAELPDQPHKTVATPPPPRAPAPRAPASPVPAAPVPAAPATKSTQAPPLPILPPTPHEPPAIDPMPELLAPPKKRAAEIPVKKPAEVPAPPPALPPAQEIVPPAPLPQFIEPGPVVAPPAAPANPTVKTPRDDEPTAPAPAAPVTPATETPRDDTPAPPPANPTVETPRDDMPTSSPPAAPAIPATETPRDDKQSPPSASPTVATPAAPAPPTIETPRDDKKPRPAASIRAKPLAPSVQPKPAAIVPRIAVPDIAVPAIPQAPVMPPANVTPPAFQVAPRPTSSVPAPIVAPPTAAPTVAIPETRPAPAAPAPAAPAPAAPAPAAPAPAAPARPPAFLLVNPRRSAPTPPPPALPPAPTLLDQSQPPEPPLASSVARVSAHVTVEKRGPAVLRQGVTATYQIVVRNRGAATSGPVTVIDEIPRLARSVTGEPAPSQLGDKAIWTLPPLPPNSETLLKLSLQAGSAGEFVGNTTVFVSAATATTRAQIEGPREPTPAKTAPGGPLAIQVRAAAGGAVGQQVIIEIQVANHGGQTLTELMLHAKLGDGLAHPAGAHIEADVGDLAAGASRTFNVPVKAVRAGRQSVEVKITAAGGAEAEASATVPVTGVGLSIQVAPTTRLLLDRDGEVRIDVTNHHGEGLRNVIVADVLPEALQFVAASDRGIYQASTRTVQWLIDYLPAGETRSVAVRIQAKTPGLFPKEVSARAENLPITRAESVVQVEGYSDLVLGITPRDQPLEVGKETVCAVRVQNFGNVGADNVQIQVDLPSGMRLGHVQGPSVHRAQGRVLIFDPIAKLPARTQAVYHIGVVAHAEGDWRIRVRVTSEQTRTPVTHEAALTAYRVR
ncbi:MAG: hypothetical protein L0Y71_02500 [Gemmataceae bacterium]|nr:hypothetical protein [Gemmataceae bacterium]